MSYYSHYYTIAAKNLQTMIGLIALLAHSFVLMTRMLQHLKANLQLPQRCRWEGDSIVHESGYQLAFSVISRLNRIDIDYFHSGIDLKVKVRLGWKDGYPCVELFRKGECVKTLNRIQRVERREIELSLADAVCGPNFDIIQTIDLPDGGYAIVDHSDGSFGSEIVIEYIRFCLAHNVV